MKPLKKTVLTLVCALSIIACKNEQGKIEAEPIENNEVLSVENPIEEEEEQTIKPSKLLNFYRKGYLILWDKLQSDYKSKIQFVKLIPSNSNSDIDYLLLGINISNDNISKLIEIGKNKTKTILSVDSIVFDPVLEKDIFIFNENNYKDYYIEKL